MFLSVPSDCQDTLQVSLSVLPVVFSYHLWDLVRLSVRNSDGSAPGDIEAIIVVANKCPEFPSKRLCHIHLSHLCKVDSGPKIVGDFSDLLRIVMA